MTKSLLARIELINRLSSLVCLLVLSCLLITFANILDPDQAGQNVEPDLGSNLFDT